MNNKLEKFVHNHKLIISKEDENNLIDYSKSLGLDLYSYQYIKEQFIFSKNWEKKQNK